MKSCISPLLHPEVDPIFYGNNVYFFPCWGPGFGKSLSRFLGNHPHLELVSMANENIADSIGYFVHFKDK